jgi:Na+/proline symporter
VWVGLGMAGMALVASGSLRVGAPDGLTPALLAASLPPWATWVAAAAIGAAIMSTTTSLLNLAAAATSWDVPRALGRPGGGLAAARRATLLVAGSALALGLAWPRALALLGVLGWGTFTASLLPAIALGLNWKGAGRRGAVVAMAAGPLVQLTLELARPSLPGLGVWEPGLTGAALGTVLMVALSRKGESA